MRTLFFNIRNCRLFTKYYSTTPVRVRFAPSPTGFLHLGGLRTALYNYLFAKSQGGAFILRIEDTDRTRLVEGAVDQLQQDLEWVGLVPDEGPKGGPFEPYMQSERGDLYRQEVERLLENGSAYYCFCTERRLDLLRRDALRNRQVPKYDNNCRSLSKDDIKTKLASNVEKCVRFKLTESQPFIDLIYGKYLHEVKDVEGDPIILKSDGFPTYHLANVVDDVKMRISHVIRGVEWLGSTNKHIMIYQALGHDLPQFAHLPLLLNPDGSKFSKRQGDLTIKSMRSKGILPNTLLNFVIQAGGGFKDLSKDSTTNIEEMISKFELKNVSTSSTRLPFDKLNNLNRLELSRQINDDQNIKPIIQITKEIVIDKFEGHKGIDLELEDDHIKKILHWSLPRIYVLQDIVNNDMAFLWSKPSIQSLQGINKEILKKLGLELSKSDFNKDTLKTLLNQFSKEQNIKYKDLMETIRTVISGFKQGPGVVDMLEILGKDAVLAKINSALNDLAKK